MEHLEECQRLQDRHDDGLCICPELRACEARVRVETLREARATTQPILVEPDWRLACDWLNARNIFFASQSTEDEHWYATSSDDLLDLVARVRADERERAAVDHPVERALVLLQAIGLDITYSDDGLRILAKQIVDMGRADERERAAGRVERVEGGYSVPLGASPGMVVDRMRQEFLAAIREGGA